MLDYAKARQNMAQCQLETNGITLEPLMALYRACPRERFVPPALASRAYLDEDITTHDGRLILEPLIEARMLQASMSGPLKCVLVLGADSLPTIALLASLATTVLVVEAHAGRRDAAQAILTEQQICNVVMLAGDPAQGYTPLAPYDAIFVPGAVAAMPHFVPLQLAAGGRFYAVLKPVQQQAGQLTEWRRQSSGHINVQAICDASCPYHAAFSPEEAFVF